MFEFEGPLDFTVLSCQETPLNLAILGGTADSGSNFPRRHFDLSQIVWTVWKISTTAIQQQQQQQQQHLVPSI